MAAWWTEIDHPLPRRTAIVPGKTPPGPLGGEKSPTKHTDSANGGGVFLYLCSGLTPTPIHFPPNPQTCPAPATRHPGNSHEHTPFQSGGRGLQEAPRPRDRPGRTPFGVLCHLCFQPGQDAKVSSARRLSALCRDPRHRTPTRHAHRQCHRPRHEAVGRRDGRHALYTLVPTPHRRHRRKARRLC